MTTRRKSYVSKPNFQIKLTIIFMLMVTIVANLVGGMCYWLISDKFHNLVEAAPDDFSEITTKDIAQFLIPKILVAQGVSLCFVFVLSILVTHTIAGPVYRMERVAKEIGQGNLRGNTRLRPRDELKELADAFNVMTEGLAAKIRVIRDEVKAQQAAGDTAELSRIAALLDEFELPEDPREGGAADEGGLLPEEEADLYDDLGDEEIIEDADFDEADDGADEAVEETPPRPAPTASGKGRRKGGRGPKGRA